MKHSIFFDGEETPTIRQDADNPWRPPRGDMSWRIEDDNRIVVEEYHPRPNRAQHLEDLQRIMRIVHG